MELRAIHCLPDSDPATSRTCHRIPRHPTEDREAAGRLGGRQIWDARGGHPAHVQTVHHFQLQGGVCGAPGTDVSQYGASGESSDGGAVDNREGDGGYPPARGEVQKDRGKGYGGAAHQSPGGLHTNSGQPRLIPGPPTGASTGRHH